MKVSRSWLQKYVDLSSVSDEDISHAITFLGFEVEGIERTGAPQLNNVFVGEVLTRDKHPDADKLSVCTVDVGPVEGVKTIVCGAQNYKVGDRVPVALVGAVLPGDFKIKESKIRGQASYGMMCAAAELGLEKESEGLLILEGRPALGTPINEVLPPGDVVFDIEITPNRPDCLSHLGVARELSAWFKKDLNYPNVGYTPAAIDGSHPELLQSVKVETEEECPLYTATVIRGVKVGPSPEWMRRQLQSVGIRPINNIVDISNYVLLEYGQPTHAFDAHRLAGPVIQVRKSNAGEKILTLDGKERTLDADTLVIADLERPVAIAGVMGGEESGVSENTTDIVLEVAIFKRQSVRRTVKKLGLSSDSSYRYERGVDPHSLEEALHRCIDLILEIAGGKVCGATAKLGGEAPWQREITVTPAYINERLGFEIPTDVMKTALESLEFNIEREDETEGRGPAWTISVPSWRDDVDRPIDLVEEILRLHGSDKIPAATVMAPGLVVADDPVVQYTRKATDYLVGHGFNECVTYTLRPAAELSTWTDASKLPALALANPFVEDQSHLRPTLIAGLLEVLKLNQSRGVSVNALCETGRIFFEKGGKTYEALAAGFVMVEDANNRSWLKRGGPDAFVAKRHIEALASAAGVDLSRQPMLPVIAADASGWQAGHSAIAGVSGKPGEREILAHGWGAAFGLIDLALLKNLGISGQVYAGFFAIQPERLKVDGARRRYQPFSLQPAALRDLALVVDAVTPAADVQKSLAKIARNHVGKDFALESVELFDVYQGTGLPEGKKSLAFSLTYRSETRTLKDDEVNAAFTKAQDEIGTKTDYQVRK